MAAIEPREGGASLPIEPARLSPSAHALHRVGRALAILVLLALLGLSGLRVVGLVDSMLVEGDDFTPYWNGATSVAGGQNPYGWLAENRPQEVRDFIYPPLLALVLAPFTGLVDYPTARWAWLWFSVACMLVGLVLTWRTSGLQAHGRPVLALLPFLALVPPTMGALGFGQLSPQLLLVAAATYAAAVEKRRPGLAGALIAVGAYLKSFPAVLGIYLLARRQWAGCLAAVGTALALVALSVLVLGWPAHWDYLTGVVPAQRRWFAAMSNISFTGFFTRLFAANGFTAPIVVADAWAQAAIGVCSAVLLGATGWAIWRARPDRPAQSAAFGAAVVAALLISPINGTQNLLIVALPLAAAAAGVQAMWPRDLRWLLVVMLLLCLPVEFCDLAPLRDSCLREGQLVPVGELPWRLGWGNLLTAGPLLGLLVLWGLLVRQCLEPLEPPS